MKRVEAIVRPEKLEDLREALDKKGFVGMTVTEVKGRGKQKGITLEWRVGEYRIEFLPKIKLEIVVDDNKLNELINIIEEVCSTGKMGDGKIFISTVDEVIRISTKERGTTAL
ncbi:transcriptional regulator [candidate division WOR-1 bacterium RIFOXYA12_FULL_43_27]|uniref:Transcriptional regulator n=1 Tax=candidate division WOR-1 bacterium RIFOXYC2_FULL_46_14 TaxID=1802587 RepID=A0A1F4U7L3_UNCSA|nr:MAG: transcriptional regulator [candidate division WOR-1 bacterium RIFOXYA12_FULL_43_27]OGC19355.1 MAG: transcriptional regulator [candidate division WOR-1 bacterium RIFOXYB2_FULL_46_45]OGC30344.1 MAG: transcriptional regulator [candidate division WOR-1 bacterium RIFOXYA2_FULL_46_56]OGC40945.1 MAG: transcriptional regulator [candidate division WOR-1 bacterium RIFOXYC2_FULL_46_14]